MKKLPKLPLPKEDDLAKACVQWFRLQYPNFIIHHSANEGRKHVRYAVKLRDMGMLAGFSDFIILAPQKAIFVELKRDPKMKNWKSCGLTDEQISFGRDSQSMGFPYLVAYSLEDFQFYCRQYLPVYT